MHTSSRCMLAVTGACRCRYMTRPLARLVEDEKKVVVVRVRMKMGGGCMAYREASGRIL